MLRASPLDQRATTGQRQDPYYEPLLDRAYLLVPAQTYVANFLGTFREFPPRQTAASFSLDRVMEQMSNPGAH